MINPKFYSFVLLSVCSLIFTGCTKKKDATSEKYFTVNGTFAKEYNDSIYITYGNKKDCTIVKNNQFVFKGVLDDIDEYQAFFRLKSGGNLGVVFLDAKNINVSFDCKTDRIENEQFNYLIVKDVWGSVHHSLWNNWTKFWKRNNKKPTFNELAAAKLQRTVDSFPLSPINGRILYLYGEDSSFDYKTIKYFSDEIDGTSFFSDDYSNINELIVSAKHKQKGAYLKNFVLDSDSGKKVSILKSHDKYTLIDFWASWCGPCRKQNSDLKTLANKHSDKLSVVSVSFDDDKKSWKDAVKKDGIFWKQYIAVDGFDSEISAYYGITSLPFNILVDKEGKIIATNIDIAIIPSLLK